MRADVTPSCVVLVPLQAAAGRTAPHPLAWRRRRRRWRLHPGRRSLFALFRRPGGGMRRFWPGPGWHRLQAFQLQGALAAQCTHRGISSRALAHSQRPRQHMRDPMAAARGTYAHAGQLCDVKLRFSKLGPHRGPGLVQSAPPPPTAWPRSGAGGAPVLLVPLHDGLLVRLQHGAVRGGGAEQDGLEAGLGRQSLVVVQRQRPSHLPGAALSQKGCARLRLVQKKGTKSDL